MLLNGLGQRQSVDVLQIQAQQQQTGLDVAERLQNLEWLRQHLGGHATTFQPASGLTGRWQTVIDDQNPVIESLHHLFIKYFEKRRQVGWFDKVASPTNFHRIQPGADIAAVGQEK